MIRLIKWALGEAWEKINVAAFLRETLEKGKKYGRRFVIAAILWELQEDVTFPLLAIHFKVPELVPLFLILHFEPVVYPFFFWCFRMWDRAQGKEPWEPDRAFMSAYWRSAMKVSVYQFASLGWLSHIVPWKPLTMFAVLIGLFGFVHERIWHDSNFGIRSDDTVQPRRVFGKTATFLSVSGMVLYPFLKMFKVPMTSLVLALGATAAVYSVLEMVWSRSMWGISKVPHELPTEPPSAVLSFQEAAAAHVHAMGEVYGVREERS